VHPLTVVESFLCWLAPRASIEVFMASDSEIIDSPELAKRWRVPETWVRDQCRTRSKYPIPHVRLGKYIRFEWGGDSLQEWWSRHRTPSKAGMGTGSRGGR
jgi:hypothetical protein